jgi:hypothetical protein
MNHYFNVMYNCMFQTACIIYVASTRSLQFYSFNSNKKSDSDSLIKSDNSLLTLKAALSIPILSTFTLLGVYFVIVNKWVYINHLLFAYVVSIATLCLKKYLYAYF